MKKILIFMTNHATLGDTSQENGTYASELTHALSEFLSAGFDYDLVTIKGGPAPLYGIDDANDDAHLNILKDKAFKAKLNDTHKAEDIKATDYDAVFYPGGYGLLSDLSENELIASITAQIYERGAPVASVCHGPAGLLPITLSNGDSILKGKSVTGFTREEEIAGETINDIPFLLEEALTLKAGKFIKVQPWLENIIEDGNLITGQNPGSAHGVGRAMVAALS